MTRRKRFIIAIGIGLVVIAAGGALAALALGGSLKSRADEFFRLAQGGNVQFAYETYTSDAFKKRTSEKALESFLSRLNISRYSHLATSEFEMKSSIAGWTGVFMAGNEPLAKVSILFVKERGEWKIEGIKKLVDEPSTMEPNQ